MKGVRLPFKKLNGNEILPPKGKFPNNIPTLHIEPMQNPLDAFLERGIVVVLEPHQATVINPDFSVEKSTLGEIHWILDCRYLNRFLQDRPFRLETILVIREMIRPHDYMISLDLSKAYYHLRMADNHRQFLAHPVTELKHLGFLINSNTMMLSTCTEQIRKIWNTVTPLQLSTI